YGGEAAWQKVASIHERGVVDSSMGGKGDMTRDWERAKKLRVDIQYAKNHEVRDLNGDTGTHNGKAVTGMGYDAMVLQWARLAIPAMLIEHRAALKDLGEKDGLRVIEIPISTTMTVMAAIDPKTGYIVRSGSEGMGMKFVTEYHDYKMSGGLLFAWREENSAQGMPTGVITLSAVDVK
ncbi:MAG TPA: hypothetical protein VH087_03630, partial [Thermoanaerobaculia bacterium]|nr:hypothetical protein [Thermoanaerobaculia bacterium]